MRLETRDLLIGLAMLAAAIVLAGVLVSMVGCDDGGFDWTAADGGADTESEETIPHEYDCEEGDCRDWTDPDPECHTSAYGTGEMLHTYDVQCNHNTGLCDWIDVAHSMCDCVWVADGPDYCI